MFVIVSDLHLGCGDELEDFLRWGEERSGPPTHLRLRARLELDELFARFLVLKMAHARSAGLLPTLILLGDIFDFWQTQRRRERPHRTLERLLSAHVGVRVALQDWLAAGGDVEFVAGAHDRPVLDTRAWAFLRDTFPGINASNGGKPRLTYVNEAVGLHAEHGSRLSPYHRMGTRWTPSATCTGREIVRRVLAPLEPMLPWVDKAVRVADVVRLLQADADASLRREAFRALAGGLRASSFLLRVLAPWLEGGLADWHRLADREEAAGKLGLRRLQALGHRRFVATGHTHAAHRVLKPGAPELLSPGAWKPTLRFDDGQTPRIEQPLGYVQLIPDGAGGWESSVHAWADEAENSPT
ncbi:MAG: hypothetical protein PWP23_2040 [Candidatus Sumerlaeota bacterium]|nr:hypothetical protein [Candidatus Sumerlaeota bacterium]